MLVHMMTNVVDYRESEENCLYRICVKILGTYTDIKERKYNYNKTIDSMKRE